MREDIVAGLRNALEREIPLEKAIQSFINAGYNPIEVRQAAESLSDGATATTNPELEALAPPIKMPSNPFINARGTQARPQLQTTVENHLQLLPSKVFPKIRLRKGQSKRLPGSCPSMIRLIITGHLNFPLERSVE